MNTRTIPSTTLTPSVICLGTGDLGKTVDQAASFAIYDAFVSAGGTFIDTAKIYSDWLPGERSSSEKTIGRWLKKRRNRDKLILATKGAHPSLDHMNVPRLSAREIESDADNSLVNLGIETIDLYYLHRDDPNRPVAEILDTLERLVKVGKIRYYGCSNWRPERLMEACQYARGHHLHGFAANQPLWNLAKIDYANVADPTLAVMDDAMFAYHRKAGTACIPFSSQANGFFHKMERAAAGGMNPNQQKMYLTDENRARFARLQEVKQRTGLTTTQVVLGYLTSQPFPVIPIVGPHNLDQLKDTLSAASTRLTTGDVAYLEHGAPGD